MAALVSACASEKPVAGEQRTETCRLGATCEADWILGTLVCGTGAECLIPGWVVGPFEF